MGRTPVAEKYKRMRFTLRHRTGGGVEGARKIMDAFTRYDKNGARGTVTIEEFTQVLKNLNVTLTDDQLRIAAENCMAGECDVRFPKVDYALFVARCFPDEAAELGVMTLEDRRAYEVTAQAETLHLGGEGQSRGTASEVGSLNGEGRVMTPGGTREVSFDAAGSPSGMNVYSPTGKDTFLRQSTDVTFMSMDGMPCKKIPTEIAREPPLNIFHGRGMEKPARPIEVVPLHEQALRALRTKVKQRVSIRNSGSGFYTLKKTLLTSFVDPPAGLTKSQFERALISMNLNMTPEHVDALFDYYSDENSQVQLDVFCQHVCHGESNAEYTGGAPPEYDFRKEGPYKVPERQPIKSTDVTFMSMDGMPCKKIPTELAREPPVNIFNGGFPMERREPEFFENAEESAMRVLREKIKQRVNIKNYGNGAYLLKKSLTKHSGQSFLRRDQFLFAIELMGLNLPKQMYAVLYEANCDDSGMVDVEAFCKKVVTY